MAIGDWIKAHPYAVGIGVLAGGGLLFVLSRESGGGSTASASASAAVPLELSQLNAGTNIQDAEIQAGEMEATAQSQTQNNELQASLDANEQNAIAQIAGSTIQGQQSEGIYQLEAGLQGATLSDQTGLENEQIEIAAAQENALLNQAPSQLQANELATILGSGNISSLNQSSTAEQAAQLNQEIQSQKNQEGFFGGLINGLLGLI